jgi:hypothetical protein
LSGNISVAVNPNKLTSAEAAVFHALPMREPIWSFVVLHFLMTDKLLARLAQGHRPWPTSPIHKSVSDYDGFTESDTRDSETFRINDEYGSESHIVTVYISSTFSRRIFRKHSTSYFIHNCWTQFNMGLLS